jgi:hypothetical protein
MNVKVTSCIQENVALESQPEKFEWVMRFQGVEKGMIMKKTNLNLMALATGQRNSDFWPGCDITLYMDPTVQFKGEMVGGVRIMVPQPGTQQQSQFTPDNNLAPVQEDTTDYSKQDDVPFP